MKRTFFLIALLSVILGSQSLLAVQPVLAEASISAAEMSDWYKQRARLSSSTRMKGKADYRDRPKKGTTEQRLKVKVEKASPNTEYDVFFNGEFLAVLTTNAGGRGKLKFRTARFNDDRNVLDLPENFPQVIDGDLIEVGPALGVFQEKD